MFLHTITNMVKFVYVPGHDLLPPMKVYAIKFLSSFCSLPIFPILVTWINSIVSHALADSLCFTMQGAMRNIWPSFGILVLGTLNKMAAHCNLSFQMLSHGEKCFKLSGILHYNFGFIFAHYYKIDNKYIFVHKTV